MRATSLACKIRIGPPEWRRVAETRGRVTLPGPAPWRSVLPNVSGAGSGAQECARQ